MDNKRICLNFRENKDIKVGDKILVKLPNEEIERKFLVKKLDHRFKNLPIVEYNGIEIVIDLSIIIRKMND
ncbi:hypothetical protein BHF71_02920 [Vulcanibacillus modesticaldus]|uniref:Uncharacterized protein n=1 Tax=Vulcanibacillus modesticaldus TaxID=337097 RepID=A0A1D2YT93_9BACI|nr:hypothetical protein [Vulcanibacillus modesticaldus]OEF98896.1 hypothetical protein BHF71_02920 [Vulcanibacillus modesticaldus]